MTINRVERNHVKKHFLAAFVGLLALAGCADVAAAASYSSYSSRSSFSSSSYSSRSYSSPSYSSSYSRSYSAPSYSAPSRPSYTAPTVSSAASAYKPAPSYNVRSTTVTSSYKPSPAASTSTYRSTTYSPSSTFNRTTVVHSPVIVHQYGYPGGYYHSGYDAFWHGYWLSTMLNRPGYGPMYAQQGYGPPPVAGYGGGWSTGDIILCWVVGIFLLAFVIWMIRAAIREG